MTQPTAKPGSAKEQKSNKTSKGLIILIILLLIALVGLLIWFVPMKGKYTAMIKEKEAQKVELNKELEELMGQHDDIKVQYGALSDSLSAKDSIIQANAKEIKELLNYKWEYRKVNKKLARLREITQGYVHQMDSLFTVNRELKEENEEIKQQYNLEVKKTTGLVKDKEELIEKVTEASILKAYNLSALGVRFTGSGRAKETDKASRVERIKVCFTLSANKIVEAGTKTIYLRIARPDDEIVTQKLDADSYTFEYKGQPIQYTSKKEIDYQNEAMDLCLFWHKKTKDAAMVGVYNASIFVDGYEIGSTNFELK